jgi:hypothetical protein
MNVIVAGLLVVLLVPTRASGGSIKTELGMGFTVNKGSTLESEDVARPEEARKLRPAADQLSAAGLGDLRLASATRRR